LGNDHELAPGDKADVDADVRRDHVEAGPDLVGTRVEIRCVPHDGSYRLAELQSETDHIVLEP